MIIKEAKTKKKEVGARALIEIDGKHGKIKCTGEDRTYFVYVPGIQCKT